MAKTLARWIARLAPGVLGLAIGCSPNTSRQSGCSGYEPPHASDAGPPAVTLQGYDVPCRSGAEVPQGSDPHLLVSFPCPGESAPFLVAVKVDGQPLGLREFACEPYGYSGGVDLGSWDPGDTLWHSVEVVLDPLNLFREGDETNNRVTAEVRLIDPDLGVYPDLCWFRLTADAGPSAGQPVEQVTAGTPVNVWLTVDLGGKYANVTMSVRAGAALDATEVRSFVECGAVAQGLTQWYTRWTPPGPGVYDVEFRVVPEAGARDRDPSNNVFVRRFTVTS